MFRPRFARVCCCAAAGLSALDDVAEEERKLSITPVKLHTAPLQTLGLFWLVCVDYMSR